MANKKRPIEPSHATGHATEAEQGVPPVADAMVIEEMIGNYIRGLDDRFALGKTPREIEYATSFLIGWVERAWLPSHEQLMKEKRLYPDRPAGQTIVDFLRTGWPARFIAAQAITRPDLRRIDPQAYMALANWLRHPGNHLPADAHIPTKSQSVDRKLIDEEAIREARRLIRAHERRRGSQRQADRAS